MELINASIYFVIYEIVEYVRINKEIDSHIGYGRGFGKQCRDFQLYNDHNGKRNVQTCFGFNRYQGKTARDCIQKGLLEDTRRIQHRCFGSLAEKVQRDPSFSTLSSDDISYFKGILGEKNVVQDEVRLAIANTDWMHKYKGSSKLLLQPRTTEEVDFFNS